MVETRPVGCGLFGFWVVLVVLVLFSTIRLFFPSFNDDLGTMPTRRPYSWKKKVGTGNLGQGTGDRTGTGDRELETGNWRQGTGAGNWGAGNWAQQTGDRELGTGKWRQGTGGRELGQGTGRDLGAANWGQGTWDRELGTGNWNWGQGTGGRELGTTLRRRERVLLLAQVEPWAGGGGLLDARVGLGNGLKTEDQFCSPGSVCKRFVFFHSMLAGVGSAVDGFWLQLSCLPAIASKPQ